MKSEHALHLGGGQENRQFMRGAVTSRCTGQCPKHRAIIFGTSREEKDVSRAGSSHRRNTFLCGSSMPPPARYLCRFRSAQCHFGFPPFSVTFIDWQVLCCLRTHQQACTLGVSSDTGGLSPRRGGPTPGRGEPSVPPRAITRCGPRRGSLPLPRRVTLPSSGAQFIKSHQPARQRLGGKNQKLHTRLLPRLRSRSLETARRQPPRPAVRTSRDTRALPGEPLLVRLPLGAAQPCEQRRRLLSGCERRRLPGPKPALSAFCVSKQQDKSLLSGGRSLSEQSLTSKMQVFLRGRHSTPHSSTPLHTTKAAG